MYNDFLDVVTLNYSTIVEKTPSKKPYVYLCTFYSHQFQDVFLKFMETKTKSLITNIYEPKGINYAYYCVGGFSPDEWTITFLTQEEIVLDPLLVKIQFDLLFYKSKINLDHVKKHLENSGSRKGKKIQKLFFPEQQS